MSTKQALGFMVGEALVIGLLAGLLGTFLGVMLGILMIEFNSNAFNFPVDTIPLTLPWIALSVSVLVGGLVSILSALVSVRRHSRLSPVEALRGIMKPSARSRSLLVALIGVALIVAGIGLGSISQSPYHLLLIAGSLLFGSVLVVPLLPRPLAFLMSKVMWGAAPAIGILVFSHMKRERSRIASMISLIMVTLALYLTASGILGGEKTNDLVHSRIPVEFPVQGPSMNQTSFQLYQAASGVKSVSIADEENSGYFINDYPFTVTGLTLVDPDALDSAQLHMFQAVAALIGTVCFFSIASALIISGIERNRETALLRAAGATPRLVASIVITESLALGLTALVVAVGTAAIVLDSCSHLLEKFEGYKPIFPWGSLPKVAVIVIVATSISALLPALRSARVSPVLAVRGD